MATTDLDICISALLLSGADEITSFTDGSREARICNQLYETTKETVLQSHMWNFSLAMTTLAKSEFDTTSAEYKFGYDNQFSLPPDYLRLIRKNSPTNDYRIVGNKLYTSDDNVEILYQYTVSETKFPSYFTRLMELEMAKLLAAALLQDDTQMQLFEAMARRELVRAKNIDSQNSPSAEIDGSNFSLTAIR